MGWVEIVFVLVVAGPTLVSLYALYAVCRMRHAAAVLSEQRPPEPSPLPPLSLVSPACNEAEHVERALRSVLTQDYPRLEIVAVDDRSSDATGTILDNLAAEDPRVKALHVQTLPHGWLGKLNALRLGTAAATGEWLLFADADVRFAPGALRRAVAWAESEGLDLLTLAPSLDPAGVLCDAFYNVVPVVLAMGGRPWEVPDPRKRTVGGMGAFILVRRKAFEASPGFEWLRLEVADDVGLGLLIKEHGGRCALANGRDLLHLGWYASYSDMVVKTQKNWFGILGRFSAPTLAAKAGLVLVGALAPLAALLPVEPTALRLLALPGPLALGAATVLASAWLGLPLRLAWLPQIGLVATAVAMLRAAWVGWREGGIRWRGELYRSEDLAPHQKVRF